MYWQWVTGAVAALLAAYFAPQIGDGLTVFTDFVQVVYPLPYVNRVYEPTPASAAVKQEGVQANVTATIIPLTTPKEDNDGGTAEETAFEPTPLPPGWRRFLTLICNEVLELITALVILESRIFLFLQQRLHLLVPLPVKRIETNSTGLKIRHLKKRLAAAKMQQLEYIASNAREEKDWLKLTLEEKLEQARWEKDTETVLLKTARIQRDLLAKELKELTEQNTALKRELDEKTREFTRHTFDYEALVHTSTSLTEDIIKLQDKEERRKKETADLRAIIDDLVERGKAFLPEEAVEDKGKGRAVAGAEGGEKEVVEEKASAEGGEKKKRRRRPRKRHGKKEGAAAGQKAEEIEEVEEGEAAGDEGNEEEQVAKDHEE
ncbi:MAG: hypothetical protein LQ351_005905 [Letrouitia transgressa]|nr:MAG: hypothetical protein LQ351_005905 [Letrouitia transgressa]